MSDALLSGALWAGACAVAAWASVEPGWLWAKAAGAESNATPAVKYSSLRIYWSSSSIPFADVAKR